MYKMKKRIIRLMRTGLPILLWTLVPVLVVAADHFSPLVGRWQRTDGGYIIDIRSIDTNCKIEAGYFNPRLINVSRAQASKKKGKIKIEVELRAAGYPGSAYNLVYIPEKDALFGYYYHAISEQFFDVLFVRMK